MHLVKTISNVKKQSANTQHFLHVLDARNHSERGEAGRERTAAGLPRIVPRGTIRDSGSGFVIKGYRMYRLRSWSLTIEATCCRTYSGSTTITFSTPASVFRSMTGKGGSGFCASPVSGADA